MGGMLCLNNRLILCLSLFKCLWIFLVWWFKNFFENMNLMIFYKSLNVFFKKYLLL